MKLHGFLKSLIVATVVSTSILFPASIKGERKYQALPSELLGSMMPYDFNRQQSLPNLGDSLTAIHVDYIARHGSRYLSGAKKIELTLTTLEDAEQKGMLSMKGKDLLVFARSVSKKSEGNWGLLSSVGIAEEERLGAEMAAMYPSLFKKGMVSAKSTYYPRVIMTMYQFLHALEIPNRRMTLSTLSGHVNDSLLSCFTYDKQYDKYRTNGDWKPLYEDFLKRHVSTTTMSKFFKKGYISNRQTLRHLAMDLYGLLQGEEAAGFGAVTEEWMSRREMTECWLASNFKHYMINNINPVSTLAGKATAPLLRQIIADIDGAETGKSGDFSGYFGHAETLLPLLSLMALPGCHTMSDDYETLSDRWKIQEITPLAANLTLTLYRSKTGRLYVGTRLNGRNVYALPAEDGSSPQIFVPWPELRAFWLDRIAAYAN